MGARTLVGVLALQGDFAAHARALERAGAGVREVRKPERLRGLAGLVVPGGESTTLLHLMRDGLFEAIREFAAAGGAVFGTCAGAIVMAREVEPAQPSLDLIDLKVVRNAYGRQLQSFEAPLDLTGDAGGPFPGVFIRAPRIVRTGTGVEVLARHGDDPVLVRSGRHLAATFHPELTGDSRIHESFLARLRGGVQTERARVV